MLIFLLLSVRTVYELGEKVRAQDPESVTLYILNLVHILRMKTKCTFGPCVELRATWAFSGVYKHTIIITTCFGDSIEGVRRVYTALSLSYFALIFWRHAP